jgi:hypothetical protein
MEHPPYAMYSFRSYGRYNCSEQTRKGLCIHEVEVTEDSQKRPFLIVINAVMKIKQDSIIKDYG